MSDGDGHKRTAMELNGATSEPLPSAIGNPAKARDAGASEQSSGDAAVANGGSSRGNSIRTLLNDDDDEVITSSDEGDRFAMEPERGAPGQLEGTSPSATSVTAHLPAPPLVTVTATSSSIETEVPDESRQLHGPNTDQDIAVEGTEVASHAEVVEVETINGPQVGDDNQAEAASPQLQARATQDQHTNELPKRRTRASARTKTPASDVTSETAPTPANEHDVHLNETNGQTKRRDKRRPTPRSAHPSPLKKLKTKSAVRPKAPSSQVVDVTMTDEDEELSADVELVVVNHAQNDCQHRGSLAAPAASIPMAKPKKRKGISNRQMEELMNDDRRPGGSAMTDLTTLGSAHASDPSPKLQKCEFCRLAHSGHTTLYCQACRRVYHDKCLVNEFRSVVQQDIPIEAQMATLTLHRPQGHGAVLRCVGCQAAFRELYKTRGVHWDCQCPTCTTDPLRIADYRRVMLKRIIDEHNHEFALKKQQKSASGGKKSNSNVPSEAKPKSKPGTLKDIALPVNARSRTRRKRGDATNDGEEKKITTMIVDNSTVASDPVASDAVDLDHEVNEEGDDGCKHIEVNSSSGDATIANTHQDDEFNGGEPDDTRSKSVTLDMLADSVSLSKDDGATWLIQIACSFPTQQGYYKEATYFWHPTEGSKIKCSCCDRVEDSLHWFVQHTDASALAALNGGSDEFQKCVVVPLKGEETVPLDYVVELLRDKCGNVHHSKAMKPRNRRASDLVAIELNSKEKMAINVLETVAFHEKPKEPKRKGNAARVQYSCTVYCAPERFIKPLANGAVCRLTLFDCGVSADAYKCGTFDIVVNPQKGKVLCSCCDERMSPAQFRLHWADPPKTTQKEKDMVGEDSTHHRISGDDTTHESEAHDNPKPVDSTPVSTERGILCVGHLDRLLGLPFDKFLEALVALKGTQAQMNELVASLSKSREPMGQTIQV